MRHLWRRAAQRARGPRLQLAALLLHLGPLTRARARQQRPAPQYLNHGANHMNLFAKKTTWLTGGVPMPRS